MLTDLDGVFNDIDWSFVDEGPAQMTATGACEIPGFVRADALPAFVDESFPTDHPRQWLGDYAVGAVAYDLLSSRPCAPA